MSDTIIGMEHGTIKIQRVEWFNGQKIVGIVVGKDTITKEIKTYVGVGVGFSEINDVKRIIDFGVKLPLKTLVKMLKGMEDGE